MSLRHHNGHWRGHIYMTNNKPFEDLFIMLGRFGIITKLYDNTDDTRSSHYEVVI